MAGRRGRRRRNITSWLRAPRAEEVTPEEEEFLAAVRAHLDSWWAGGGGEPKPSRKS